MEKLPLIYCPVLLVRGERDTIVPMKWLEKAHRLVPSSSLAVIPAAAHAVNFNSPEELVALVNSFTQGIASEIRDMNVPTPYMSHSVRGCVGEENRESVRRNDER